MYVLDFMNSHDDWADLLVAEPYFIKISVDEDTGYILLKYNMLVSDLSNPIVQECRGAIFTKKDDKYICICRAFDKFFNHGEANAATLDWNSVSVEEKVDGSLIKFYYYDNRWNIATNGTSDAFKAKTETGDFGQLVAEALGGEAMRDDFFKTLNTNYTYMFELVSPKSQVTIYYKETKLYYLGQRNMKTMKEEKDYTAAMQEYGVLCPKNFPLYTLEDCLTYVNNMTKDEEGFVIKDKFFNRIKLKSPEFLIAFHCNNNGVITIKRVVDMMKNNQIDDFLAYAPQWRSFVYDIQRRLFVLADRYEEGYYATAPKVHNKRELADEVAMYDGNEKAFIFRKYNNPSLIAIDYIMELPTSKIKDLIKD